MLALSSAILLSFVAGCQKRGNSVRMQDDLQRIEPGKVGNDLKKVSDSRRTGESDRFLITPKQIGMARLGMSVGDLKANYPKAKYEADNISDVDTEVVAVRENGETLFYFTTRQLSKTGKFEVLQLDDTVDFIATDNEHFRTMEGVGPKTSIAEAAKFYGKPIIFYSTAAEYIKFEKAPTPYMAFWAGNPQDEESAGIFATKEEMENGEKMVDGYAVTEQYHQDSYIRMMSVRALDENEEEIR